MFCLKRKKHLTGGPIDKILDGVRVKDFQTKDMVCGNCGTNSHGVYELVLGFSGLRVRKKTQEGRGRRRVIIVECKNCNQIRPLDTGANDWLFDMEVISQSEHLSYSR